MTEVKIKVLPRTGKSRALRRQGMIPAVIYGQGVSSEPVELSGRELENILLHQGRNALINIIQSGRKSPGKHVVMVKDLQRDPIKGSILHADLYKISLRDKIHAAVPVHLAGESPGVKKGGILQHGLRELEIECLPTKMPELIELDVSGLKIGDHLTVADLPDNPDYKILSDPGAILVTVVAPRMAEQPDTTETAGPAVAPAKPEAPAGNSE